MAAVLDSPVAERLVLREVSWNTYESLLGDFQDRSSPRMTYSDGALEIMSPSSLHESWNRNLAFLIRIVAATWGVRTRDFGSTTFKRADLECGFEPDSCFYIQHAAQMKGKSQINLENGDPAPDLVIEIDVTNPSLPKLPLFSRIGIPEVWMVNGRGEITFLILQNGAYIRTGRSLALPLLTEISANGLLQESLDLEDDEWLLRLQQWAQEQRIDGSV